MKQKWIRSALYAVLLTVLTFVADAAGGHPAKSAPVFLFVVWLAVVVAARWVWRLVRR